MIGTGPLTPKIIGHGDGGLLLVGKGSQGSLPSSVMTGKMMRMGIKHLHELMNMSVHKAATLSSGARAITEKEVWMTSRNS